MAQVNVADFVRARTSWGGYTAIEIFDGTWWQEVPKNPVDARALLEALVKAVAKKAQS